MNLSMVPALSTLRFAGLKPAPTPRAFSVLAPTRADVFFASTVRFGRLQSPLDYTASNNLRWETNESTSTLYNGTNLVGGVSIIDAALAEKVDITPVLSKGGVALRIKPKGQNFSITVTPGGKVNAFGITAELTGQAPAIPSEVDVKQALKTLASSPAGKRPRPTNINPKEHKVVILASGGGTRLKELTSDTPKPLFPLANGKSMLRNLIDQLLADGFAAENIAITIPPNQQQAFANDLEGTEVNRFFVQAKADGTADAINQFATSDDHKKWLNNGKSVVVLGADHIDNLDMAQLLSAHEANNAGVTVGTYIVPKAEILKTFGLVKTIGGNVESGKIDYFIEKPQPCTPEADQVAEEGDAASTFKQVLSAEFLKRIETYCATTADKEKDLSNGVIKPYIEQGGTGWNFVFAPTDGYAWTDAGAVKALARDNSKLLLGGRISKAATGGANKHVDAKGVFYQNPEWRKELEGKLEGPVWVMNNN